MPPAETISVTLPPETVRALRERVEAGEYASVGDALEDAVRAWQSRRREDAERLDAIRARIRRSLDDPSPPLSVEGVRAHLKALHAETVKAHRNATP
ncbi:type II toxin-antitoxin system ParD family antitoxin [Methylobacterium sp. J-077]|uniref:ribbon-helix-helix domain-containing protein n=1 Tax=Methylobacterium sp. J-077 TaxID=2836656 RepID=UPI001FBA5933|nr:ribbon-helix-helix protein, CopG family [Methylobacterium sp. J-077]MCJ2124983.1 ribbon-helix-helix protein, CopG family [Methylobacterium sp. J-077]